MLAAGGDINIAANIAASNDEKRDAPRNINIGKAVA